MPQRLPKVIAEEDFKNRFIASLKSKSTAAAYDRDLSDFADRTGYSDEKEAVEALLHNGSEKAHSLVKFYLTKLRGKSAATINRRLSVLRSLIRFAHSEGRIEWGLSIHGIKSRSIHPPSPLGLEDVRRLLRKRENAAGPAAIRDLAILRLIAELALKRSDVRRLNVSDFDPTAKTIRLHRRSAKKRPKLPLSEKTASTLEAWLLIRPGRPSGALFVNLIPGRHARLSGEGICLIVRKSGDSASGRLIPNNLRRASIVGALKLRGPQKLSLESISVFSGFKSPSALSPYVTEAEDGGHSISSAVAEQL